MPPRLPVIHAGLALLAVLATAPACAGARLGLEAGLNESKVTLSPGFGLPGPAYRAAWSTGLTLDVPVTPRLSFATELRYLEYGERVTVSIVSFDGSARFERLMVWRYLAIPAHLRVHPTPGLYLAAGPEASCLLTIWHQDHVYRVSGPVLPPAGAVPVCPHGKIFEELGSFFADPHGAYSRWNLALSSALGCEVPLGHHSGRIEARYTHGLVDIAKSDALKRSTRGLELLLGVRW